LPASEPRTDPSDGATALTPTLVSTDLPFPLLVRGKVRDVYDLGQELLMVATDRVSAFDVVMPEPIPRKGEVLTLISAWWFRRTADLVPNHLISIDPDEIAARHPALAGHRDAWARRAMLVRKLRPFPVECVVRGYVAGSARAARWPASRFRRGWWNPRASNPPSSPPRPRRRRGTTRTSPSG
jgi:phosphoribosylaminoimidazole-succinocarboxamide synthase